MKKLSLSVALGLLLSFLSQELQAQDSSAYSAPQAGSRFVVGASLGLGASFGGGGSNFSLGIAPRVGYLLNERTEAGLKVNASWQNSKYYASSLYGVGPYLHYYAFNQFYLSGSYEHYFLSQRDKYNDDRFSTDEPTLWLGAGYTIPLGGTMAMHLGASYNVLYKKNSSIFSSGFSPSMGFTFGF